MRAGHVELTVKQLPPGLFIRPDLTPRDIAAVLRLSKEHSDRVRAGSRGPLSAALEQAVPQWSRCAEAILRSLATPPYFCILRACPWVDLPPQDLHQVVTALVAPLGHLSDDNAYSTGSGIFADDVRPTDAGSRDVTYSFDCEVHSDESSKPVPEDIVTLWCVHPGEDGGGSLVWSTHEIVETLRSLPEGRKHERVLREHRFPFGGKLRQPPRVLCAPILFGSAGVRFRLGALQDAFEVLGRSADRDEQGAIDALLEAVRLTPAYAFTLGRGDASCMMNRKTLHSRTPFSDPNRWLIRVRVNNSALSNSREDGSAGWSDAALVAVPKRSIPPSEPAFTVG